MDGWMQRKIAHRFAFFLSLHLFQHIIQAKCACVYVYMCVCMCVCVVSRRGYTLLHPLLSLSLTIPPFFSLSSLGFI